MSVVIQVSEVIDRPVAATFHFYAHDHVHNHPRWDPDMRLEQLSDGPIGVGTVIRRIHTHAAKPVEGVMRIVEFQPDSAFAVEIQDGPVRTNGRVTFHAIDLTHTRITIYAEFPDSEDPSLEQLLTPLIQRSARNIKNLLESEL